MKNRIKLAVGSAIGAVTSFGLVAMAHAADALDAMTSSSAPTDFATAAISDTKGYLYPVLGKLFIFAIIIAVVWLVFRMIYSKAKGKH